MFIFPFFELPFSISFSFSSKFFLCQFICFQLLTEIFLKNCLKVPNGEETLISCVDDERIDFEEGDIVKLLEVEGMDGIEDVEFTVKDVQKTSFKIGSTTKFSPYVNGGTVVQQKQPKVLEFAPLVRTRTQIVVLRLAAKYSNRFCF